MASDPSTDGIANVLLTQLGVADLQCLRDETLVIGLKQTFEHLAPPAGDGGPMDQPTMGLILLAGPDCVKPEIGVEPGMLVYFAKFTGLEIEINGKRFFTVKGSDIKIRRKVALEQINSLVNNSY